MSLLECVGGLILLSSTILISTETAKSSEDTNRSEEVNGFDAAKLGGTTELIGRDRENSTGGTSLRSAGSPMPRSLNHRILSRRNTDISSDAGDRDHRRRMRSGSEGGGGR